MREFDARTQGPRERAVMTEVAALRRAALAEPARADELFAAACAAVPALPLKVQIQTATRCNAACSMCPYPVVTGEPGFVHGTMSEARYLRILDELRGGGVERLSLFLMNEPLLDRRLASWLRHARTALPGATLGLFSNGSALDADRARELADAGLDELCVSVHGFAAATYETLMVGLSHARLRHNLDAVLALAARGELGALRIQIVAGDIAEVTATRALAPEPYRDRLLLKAFSNERAAVGVPGAVPSSCAAGEDEAVCQRPFVKLYVLATGECVLCNVDWRRTVVLGQIGDPDGARLADVWRGPAYTAVRREQFTRRFVRSAICARCDYARVADHE